LDCADRSLFFDKFLLLSILLNRFGLFVLRELLSALDLISVLLLIRF